jgi:ABC-type uncharacterized transport system permease subunit
MRADGAVKSLRRIASWSSPPLRYLLIILVALAIFSLILLVVGKDPAKAYKDTFAYTFGNAYRSFIK